MSTTSRLCMYCDSPVGPDGTVIEVCIFEVTPDGARSIARGFDPVKAPLCGDCRPHFVREWSEILSLTTQKGYRT
jgi:7-cyano-7-deazaguanine synthase in queuosine biosynthesis